MSPGPVQLRSWPYTVTCLEGPEPQALVDLFAGIHGSLAPFTSVNRNHLGLRDIGGVRAVSTDRSVTLLTHKQKSQVEESKV